MTENMNEEKAKAYELRDLTADDMFPMFQIISKIGIKEFKSCFESESVRKLVAEMSSGESGDELKAAVGVTVVLDIASVILSNIGNCKDDIYLLLSQLSGLKTKDIAKLPMPVFMGMIMEVIKKKEFTDFFQDVVKLFK